MKRKKGKKNSSGKTIASGTSTNAWEKLLAGGAAAANKTVNAGTEQVQAGTAVAPRSDKLPTKTKGLGNLYTSMSNNWEHLLTGGKATTAAAGAGAGNGHVSDKSKRKKAKSGSKGSKRPRSEIGQAGSSDSATPTTPDFFPAKRVSNGVQPQPVTGPGGKAGSMKRKRASADSADGNAKDTSVKDIDTYVPGTKHKQQKQHHYSGAPNWKKPGSNVLNLAFLVQKEEAAAAAAAAATGAGGNAAKHRGRDKGRGSRAGGRRGSEQALTAEEKAQYVALDCEMVGVGPGGCRSALARCCLVDWEGNTM